MINMEKIKKLNYMYVYVSGGKVKSYYTNNIWENQVKDALKKLEGKDIKLLERKFIGD